MNVLVTNLELSSSFTNGTRNFYTKDVSVIFTLDPLGKMFQFHEYVFQTGASTTAKRNLKVH